MLEYRKISDKSANKQHQEEIFLKIYLQFVKTAMRRYDTALEILDNTPSYPSQDGTAFTLCLNRISRALQFFGETALITLPESFFRERWQLSPGEDIAVHWASVTGCFEAYISANILDYTEGAKTWTDTRKEFAIFHKIF